MEITDMVVRPTTRGASLLMRVGMTRAMYHYRYNPGTVFQEPS
jgi:hypothetical protein